MKRFLVVLTILIMSVAATPAFAQKFAVIDLQRSVMTSDAGKKASDEMREFENSLAGRLQPLRDEYQKMENDFRAQEKVLSDAARRTRIEAIQRKGLELETAVRTYTNEAQRKNDELLNTVFKDLELIIADVAKKGKFDVILHKQTVAHAPGLPDITDDVIAAYNKQFNAKK